MAYSDYSCSNHLTCPSHSFDYQHLLQYEDHTHYISFFLSLYLFRFSNPPHFKLTFLLSKPKAKMPHARIQLPLEVAGESTPLT